MLLCFFFFKQKTAYEMRISDWSSDVCSSDPVVNHFLQLGGHRRDQVAEAGALVGEIEPDAVGAGEQQRGNQEDRPARHLAFRRRRREMQLGLAVEAVDLCLEALDDLVAVETEVIGVAAQDRKSTRLNSSH